jgi:hypothetical protein
VRIENPYKHGICKTCSARIEQDRKDACKWVKFGKGFIRCSCVIACVHADQQKEAHNEP